MGAQWERVFLGGCISEDDIGNMPIFMAEQLSETVLYPQKVRVPEVSIHFNKSQVLLIQAGKSCRPLFIFSRK